MCHIFFSHCSDDTDSQLTAKRWMRANANYSKFWEEYCNYLSKNIEGPVMILMAHIHVHNIHIHVHVRVRLLQKLDMINLFVELD